MNKITLFLSLFLSLLYANEKKDVLIFSGPMATVSHPFFKIIEDGALEDVAKKVIFKEWKSPDELRAIALKGDADFAAMPTNTAAILYNKSQNIKLLSVSVWGIMSVISADESIKSIEDLKNQEVLVPFRSDMPDIVLQALLKKGGFDIKNDIKLNYVATPPDAVSMLVSRKAKNALLVEPITSMAMLKTSSFPQNIIAPTFYRAIDLQNEWGRLFGGENKIPQAGIASIGNQDERVQKRVVEEYEKALDWYKQNPKDAAKLVAKNLKAFNEKMIEESISHIKLENTLTINAKNELNALFEILYDINPKIIGEKIPDEGFYK